MKEETDFILAHTSLAVVPFVPELCLHATGAIEPLWRELEVLSGDPDVPLPFWAAPWAGGLGLARFLLDHPDTVKGKRVLDFASGSGLVGIAAAKAGAAKVWSCDIDPLARAACALNATANDVVLHDWGRADFAKPPKGVDVVLAGDVCYDHLMAHRTLAWLRLCAEAKLCVLLGDPARAYSPCAGVEPLAAYTVPTSPDLEDRAEREVRVLKIIYS